MATGISGKTDATAGVGTVSGVGLAPLIVWILGLNGIEIDGATAAVLGGVVGQVASLFLSWLVPVKSDKHVDTDPWVHESADESVAESDETDSTDGANGGMTAYASEQAPEIEGGLIANGLLSRISP